MKKILVLFMFCLPAVAAFGFSDPEMEARLKALKTAGSTSFDVAAAPMSASSTTSTSGNAEEEAMAKADKALKDALYDQAIKAYDEILSSDPGNARALNNAGIAHYHLGQFDKALEMHRRALAVRPHDASFNNNAALDMYALDRINEAAEFMKKAVELDPGNPMFKDRLAAFEKALEKALVYTNPTGTASAAASTRIAPAPGPSPAATVFGVKVGKTRIAPDGVDPDSDEAEIWRQTAHKGGSPCLAIKRQMFYHPADLGFEGDADDEDAVRKWGEIASTRAAIDAGIISEEGVQIRTAAPETTRYRVSYDTDTKKYSVEIIIKDEDGNWPDEPTATLSETSISDADWSLIKDAHYKWTPREALPGRKVEPIIPEPRSEGTETSDPASSPETTSAMAADTAPPA